MELMLCETGSEKDLDNPLMAAELKADGTHVMAKKADGKIRVFGRPKKTGIPEYTDRLPDLIESLEVLSASSFEIVGEAVVYDENNRTWFEGSQRRCSTQDPAKIRLYQAQYPIILLAFDITELDGKDTTGYTYQSRKEMLLDLIEETPQTHVEWLPHVVDNKRDYYNNVIAQGEEGVILKRLNSTYERRRSKSWLKVKKWDAERLKVVGFTEGTGDRASTFGSLVLAKLEDDGSLRYRGKVGTGFNDIEVMKLYTLLTANVADVTKIITPEPYTPVELPLEVTVKFFEETKNHVIRFPSMLKDERGKNMIHYESTIEGKSQKTIKQRDLKALLESLTK